MVLLGFEIFFSIYYMGECYRDSSACLSDYKVGLQNPDLIHSASSLWSLNESFDCFIGLLDPRRESVSCL